MPTWEQYDGFQRMQLDNGWIIDEPTYWKDTKRGEWPGLKGRCVSCSRPIPGAIYFGAGDWRCDTCAHKEGIVW